MWSPVSVVVSNMNMEDLEDEAIHTAPQDSRPSMCRWYINNLFQVVMQDTQDELTKHLNSIHTIGTKQFTDEPEMGGVSCF